jgi:O-succinylbenzoic acid--CoA ligase
MTSEVVALDLPGGPAYVEAIRRVWETGDAVAPVDPRLPPPEARRVMDALAPTAVIEADGQRRSLPAGRPAEAGDALLIATSGTTGDPKVVIHTMASVAASAWAVHRALDVDPHRDRWLACLPLSHIGGLAVVLRSLLTETPVEVHDRFEPDETVAALDRGATLVSLVTRALNQVPVERLRVVLLGGAAPPPDRPANVIATYGLTETGSGIVYDRRPLDGVEIDIDPEGEIRVRGPMLFRAYRHDPQPLDSDGWFATGDLGRWANDGQLVVHGRRGDVIVTGGEKVWPGPVESLLRLRADVADVALIGRPDPEWGHRVVAVVVPRDPASPPSLDDLRAQVKERFGSWCAPRELELRSELPTTPLGKVRRHDLA